MKLYARQQGEGEHLISVHGLFGSQENLGAINRQLAEKFRVHGLDVRNHGRSPHDAAMDYSVMAEDIVEYLDEQQIEKAHLLGHSMGGKVVMEVALAYPDRVERLAVMDIAPVHYKVRRHDDVFSGLFAVDLENMQKRGDADQALRQHVEELAVRSFLLKNLYRNEAGSYSWRMNLDAIHHHYLNILAGPSAKGSFEGDVLFLKGGHSDYILAEHREEVLKHFPNASMREIADTGHWLHAEKPELVARTLMRFLES
ncbi:alpha/beta fold hydrolase [Endozoicomonas numazuensis]|uniref:Acyl-CoA esterase n=1 Tax=Endozoicomonas numazuensis TaxID=1137799 RepID=A0A081NM08_9GAMM|nr:alpha/beta fold hydrolase [Endozoicomonas numazuensis]KEQ19481.1 acyl-CoA esterase [Endozoicomonas numazuensis]